MPLFKRILVLVCALAIAGCEQSSAPTPENDQSTAQASTEPTSRPNAVATTMPAATTIPMPMAAISGASTLPSTTQAASRPVDPLETPESTVRNLLELSAAPKLPPSGLQTIITWFIEPPPDEELVQKLNKLRVQLFVHKSSWEISDSLTHGYAAGVIYTIRPAPGKPGKPSVNAVLLLDRYGRWKMFFSEPTPLRYTETEKNDMIYVANWVRQRMADLQTEVASTQPTSTTTQAAPAPASAPARTP